ncbi:2-oxoglutarate oxidoreductase [Romboutsia weinsteinii]|uniref:2-oxoglutarate oxidoreductase n=1 Tax=Romboutsia weinsteinii TaxID=2020949 RepID=A0A371IYI3_9FIRM|nr:thiamine pyrophosphate-dependent enzyme [Romboutsia weinsteinii]RDY25543.1 2-oxoglutarate oxidoreductase [Romboutsia weinsteinii]
MSIVFKETNGLTDVNTHYCPGCTHGIIHRLVGEVIEELGVIGDTIGVAPVGCSVLAYKYFNCDMQEASHGRAPACATGIKRVHPDKTVFTYQGDGDLASIGTAEIVHAAARGEKFTTVFVNNAIYGMTGGQMAPTTLVGQKATTAQDGRDIDKQGFPIRISEMLATLTGAVFVERVSVDTPANVRKAKKAIKKAFQVQHAGLGFGIVEVLSTCPTNWGLAPNESLQWLRDNMIPYYPLGNIKDIDLNKEVK